MPSGTKQRILKAAVELFVRKGVAGTTTRDIAAAAEIAEGTIYRHFESKDALAAELFLANYLPYASQLRAVSAACDDPREAVAAMLRHFCGAFDRAPELMTYLLIAQHGQFARIPEGAETPVDVLRAAIARGVKAGTFRRLDPSLATYIVLGILLEPAKAVAGGALKGRMTSHAPAIVDAAARCLAP